MKALKPILLIGGGLFTIGIIRLAIATALPQNTQAKSQAAGLQLPKWLTEEVKREKQEAADEAKAATAETLLNPNTPDRMTVAYNANLATAIETAEADLDESACARSARYLEVAYQQNREKGIGVEHWLLEQLAKNSEDGKALVRQYTTLDGSPTQQDAARPNINDRLAILKALESVQNGSTPNCRANLADSIRASDQLHYVAVERLNNQFAVAEPTEPDEPAEVTEEGDGNG